jgi:hypothetical protein
MAGAEGGAGIRRDLRYVRQVQADAYTAARDWSTSVMIADSPGPFGQAFLRLPPAIFVQVPTGT